MTASSVVKPTAFRTLWDGALLEYRRNTDIDLEDPTVFQPRDLDDLINYLSQQHFEFCDDSRSSKFTGVIKKAIGPFNFLTATVGDSAAQLFPGGSQVLAAFAVLVNAGAAVTQSFDAVSALFSELGEFTVRLKVVRQDGIPDALVPIYQAILVSLLNVCALAARMSFAYLKEEKPQHGKWLHSLRKRARPAVANVNQYVKQLMGGDSEVSAAVGTLRTLVDNESRMMQAITVGTTTRIESIAVYIQGLTVKWSEAVFDLQADTSEVKLRVISIEESQGRVEGSQGRIEKSQGRIEDAQNDTRDNIAEIKAMNTEWRKAQDQQHKTVLQALEKAMISKSEKSGAGKQNEAGDKSKSAVSSESKLWKKLEERLGVKSLRMANSSTFERLSKERLQGTAEWVLEHEAMQKLFSGENGFLVISGDAGHGKTFLASRIIDHITSLCKPGSHGTDNSMAYFFCRKGQTEEQYVSLALKTMAYEIARSDKLYAKHLTDLAEGGKLSQDDGIVQRDATDDTNDAGTFSSAEPPNTAVASDGGTGSADDNNAPADGQTNVEPSEDPMLTQKLRRVNTAVIEGQTLKDAEEENAVRPVQRHWEHLFAKYFTGTAKHVYLVLDGLDECKEIEAVALCSAINASFLAADRKPRVNIHLILFMTTRRAKIFTPELLSAASVLQVRKEFNWTDLKRFVNQRLQKGWQSKLVDPQLRNEARKAVLDNCDGNFLRASLTIDEIVSFSREDVVRSFLRDLPTSVESAMLLVIQRLSRQLGKHDLEDLHDILAWVACARRDLSLAELDAMLSTRRVSARVLDLEARLRGSFATLFTVNGQMTVEDSVKNEQIRRRLEAIGTASIALNKPEEQPEITARNTADDDDENEEGVLAQSRATANMHRSSVVLSHTLIAEQIQKRTAQAGITNFTTDSMQGTVLLQCLGTLCDVNGAFDEPASQLSGRYSGLYLSDHVLAVEPNEVELEVRSRIVKLLLKLFREPPSTERWVRFAAGWLANDFTKPSFHNRTMQWLQDPDAQDGLDASEVQWIQDASNSPFASLFGGVALAVARRWLTKVIGDDEDCVKFLQIYLDAVKTAQTGDLQPDRTSFELASLSTDEILKIAEWTKLEKNARWYSRIGRLLRSLDRNIESLEMFKKAIQLNSEDAHIRGGMGVTYAAQGNFEDAAKEASASVELFIEAIKQGVPSPDPDHSMVYGLMTTREELATYYVNLDKTDEAREVYETIMADFEAFDTTTEDWNELLSVIIGYYRVLTKGKRWDDCATLLQRLMAHPQRLSEEFAIYWYIAFNESMLLQIGYHRKNFDVLIAFNDHALANIGCHGNEDQISVLAQVRAMLFLRLDQSHTKEAIRLLKLVAQDEEVDEWTKDRADRELARYYLNQTLQAREKDQWIDAGRYADSLVRLVTDEKDHDDNPIFETRGCALVLAAWDRINGRMDRARQCAKMSVTLGIDMLSDIDPENDIWSWMYLADAFLAIGEKERAVAATNMCRQIRFVETDTLDDTGSGNDPGKIAKETNSGDTQAGADQEPLEALPTSLDGEETISGDNAHGVNSNTAGSASPEQAPRTLDSGPAIPDKSTGTFREDKPQSTASQQKVTTTPGATFYYCDGCCFEGIVNNAPMWRCSFCIADFCESCHKLIMDDKMDGWNICGDKHEHIEIPGLPTKYPPGIIRVEEEDVQVTELVATLREEWDYPVKDVATIS